MFNIARVRAPKLFRFPMTSMAFRRSSHVQKTTIFCPGRVSPGWAVSIPSGFSRVSSEFLRQRGSHGRYINTDNGVPGGGYNYPPLIGLKMSHL